MPSGQCRPFDVGCGSALGETNVQIIVMSSWLKQPRNIQLRKRWLAGAAAAFAALFLLTGSGLSFFALQQAIAARVPFVQQWVAAAAARDLERRDEYVRQNIDALAVKLGTLQAQVARIDAISERVAGLAGVKPGDLPKAAPGQGGALPSQSQPLSLGELLRKTEAVTRQLEQRQDGLAMAEVELLHRLVTSRLLPTKDPLPDGFVGSRFGVRIDPFTGRNAMHEGIDFNAPVGTPIIAAGSGQVLTAGWHPGYGNHIDLDHGQGLVTRYAHASRLLVKEGDIVKDGQHIADVGSTGRSTGAHLHFEVRRSGEAIDPLAYLQQSIFPRVRLQK